MKAEITEIFKDPIYKSNLNRPFSNKEKLTFKNCSKNLVLNIGNNTSKNKFILNEKPLLKLKKELEIHLNNFIKDILRYKDISIYITQSWLNITEKNQYHHPHSHPNSFLSGVLYIEADSKIDSIIFQKIDFKTFEPEPYEYNPYNAKAWEIMVGSGDVVIFSSHLTHKVKYKNDDNKRISLAFNSFLKGKIGSVNNLSELKL